MENNVQQRNEKQEATKFKVKSFQIIWKLFRRAIDGARTRGLDLGKVARYQLRHYRICMYLCQIRLISYNTCIILSTLNLKKFRVNPVILYVPFS